MCLARSGDLPPKITPNIPRDGNLVSTLGITTQKGTGGVNISSQSVHPTGATVRRAVISSPETEQSGLATFDLARLQHLVDETVFFGLFGGQELIAVNISANLIDATVGVLGEDFFHPGTNPQQFVSVNL